MSVRSRLVALGAGVVLVIAVLAIVGLQVDRVEVAYPTYFQAKAEEAVDRGWIPEWLPEESTDVREAHDPNVTAALLRATVPTDVELPETCQPAGSIADPALTADWFPTDAPSRGEPLQCDDWVGVRDGDALLLWRP